MFYCLKNVYVIIKSFLCDLKIEKRIKNKNDGL